MFGVPNIYGMMRKELHVCFIELEKLLIFIRFELFLPSFTLSIFFFFFSVPLL